MTDQLERDLTALFHERATTTDAPPVPLQRLIRDGEAAAATRRRRTRLAVAGAVAAAVVIAVAVPYGVRQLAHDDSSPGPADVPEVVNTSTERPDSIEDLPVGPDPAVPYVVDDTLHFRGATYDVPAGVSRYREQDGLFQSAGDTVVLIEQHDDPDELGERFTVYVPRGAELVSVLEVSAVIPPILSADGSVVAVVTSEGLTSYAVPSGEELGTIAELPPNPPLAVPVVDADGRVLWSRQPTYLLSPGQEPQRVDLPTGSSVIATTPSGVLVEDGQDIVHGTVSADGGFTPEWSFRLSDGYGAEVPDGSDLVWQPRYVRDESPRGSGDRFVSGPGRVAAMSSGEYAELLLPEDVALNGWTRPVGAEGEENLLFSGSRGGLRCSVVTGACDRILADLPDDAAVTFSNDTIDHSAP